MPAHGLLVFITSREQASFTIAFIYLVICNNGNKTLSTRRYSARLTRLNKIKDSKDHDRLIWWSLAILFAEKHDKITNQLYFLAARLLVLSFNLHLY